MNYPYGVISDLHLHAWDQFKTQGSDGEINSRLEALLQEIVRIGTEVSSMGGDTLFVAGDVFHVRGKLMPSVLNPVKDLFQVYLRRVGITKIHIIPGNHDLEGKGAASIGDAVRALRSNDVEIVEAPSYQEPDIAMIPWMEDIEQLKGTLLLLAKHCRALKTDVIIHAPIDGVLPHLSGGLDPKWLADLGFRNIFAGHYHSHKDCGGGVYSIGSIAHHTWSDAGSQPGWLLVREDGKVEFKTSMCPRFIEITPEMDPFEAEMAADGNYVKVFTELTGAGELAALKKGFMDLGAKGVIVVSQPKKTTVARSTTTVKSGVSIENNIASFVDATSHSDEEKEAIKKVALEVLNEVRAV